METEERKSVRVRIFGEEFPIRSEADPEYTKKVAKYVDSMMRHVKKGMKSSDARTVAILAAMSITDELFRSRQGLNSLGEELARKTKEILNLIEEGRARGNGKSND
ncbi:MAG: cell division protein ZapA [Candidatus Glassbacteria bacterium]